MSAIEIRRRQGFTIIENAVLEDRRLSHYSVLVYLALARHADQDKKCWPSWRRIGELARCGRTAVHTALRELAAYGYLVKEARNGSSCIYMLTTPEYIPVRVAGPPRPCGGLPPVRMADPEQDPIEPDTGIPAVAPETALGQEAKQCLDYHFAKHKAPPPEGRGFEPIISGARDMKLIKGILRKYDVQAFKDVDDAFFAWPSRSDFGIPALFRRFDTLFDVLKSKAEGRRR